MSSDPDTIRLDGESLAMKILAEVHPERLRHLTDLIEDALHLAGATAIEGFAATALLAARIGEEEPRFDALMVAVAVMMKAHREAMERGGLLATSHPDTLALARAAAQGRA